MDREGSEKEDSGSLYSPNYSQSLASVSVKRTECSIDKKRGREGGGGGGGFSRKKPGNIFFDNLVPSRMAEMMERQCRVAVSFVRSRENSRQKKEEGEKKRRRGTEPIVLVHAPEPLNKQYHSKRETSSR